MIWPPAPAPAPAATEEEEDELNAGCCCSVVNPEEMAGDGMPNVVAAAEAAEAAAVKVASVLFLTPVADEGTGSCTEGNRGNLGG